MMPEDQDLYEHLHRGGATPSEVALIASRRGLAREALVALLRDLYALGEGEAQAVVEAALNHDTRR